MLKSFEMCECHKGYEKYTECDFSKTRDYDFNKNLIKDNVIDTSLIYGCRGRDTSEVYRRISRAIDMARDVYKNNLVINKDSLCKEEDNFTSFDFVFRINGEDYSWYLKINDNKEVIEEIISKNENPCDDSCYYFFKRYVIDFLDNKIIYTNVSHVYDYYDSFEYNDYFIIFYDEYGCTCSELEKYIRAINSRESSFQSIFITNNTCIMSNLYSRPDCCFLFDDIAISLADCTYKIIREAHNLEKMYRNGAFRLR